MVLPKPSAYVICYKPTDFIRLVICRERFYSEFVGPFHDCPLKIGGIKNYINSVRLKLRFSYWCDKSIWFCRKNIVNLRQENHINQMQSLEDRIITSIAKRGRGSIISPLDYASYGDSKAVQKAFERLTVAEKLIRVARGIYCYPKIDKVLGLGVLHPTFEEIAAAIARRDQARIVQIGRASCRERV